jgi:hypothetical protein
MRLLQFENFIDMLPKKNFRAGKYEEALDKFESVLGSKPEIDESSVASYNVACCYSKLDRVCLLFHCELLQDCKSASTEHSSECSLVQIQAGLSALEDAMKAGYEDFKVTRKYLLSKSKKRSMHGS